MPTNTPDSIVCGSDSASIRAVEAVAEREGTDPVDLPPLFDAIDPDALDSLFESTPTGMRSGDVTFSYAGYRVTVTCEAGRTISIDLAEPTADDGDGGETTTDRFRLG